MAALISQSTLFARELGELPKGFSWHESDTCHAAVPVPKGWYVKEEGSGDTHSLTITKENIEQTGRYETGYTLSCYDSFSRTVGVGPSKYAASIIEKVQQTNDKKNIVVEPWANVLTKGAVKGAGIRFRDAKPPPALIHYYFIANEQTDTLHFIIFEAPEAEWAAAWKLGEVMLTNVVVWSRR